MVGLHWLVRYARYSGSIRQRAVYRTEVPDRICALKGLWIDCVQTQEELAIWNTLMAEEHPQGATKFAGIQKKYLFPSEHGYLGGIGVAAAALYLAPREA